MRRHHANDSGDFRLLINVVAVLLVSNRRFAGWDVWLIAMAIAIVVAP